MMHSHTSTAEKNSLMAILDPLQVGHTIQVTSGIKKKEKETWTMTNCNPLQICHTTRKGERKEDKEEKLKNMASFYPL